jgi:predicted Zn-dependent protease
MPDCPFIYCALFVPESVRDLDEKARGLCPPCMGKLADLKAKLGIAEANP